MAKLPVHLCTSAFAVCMAAMASFAFAAENFPMGAYTSQGTGHTLIFEKNGQFRLVGRKDMLVEGEYRVNGGEVWFTDKRGVDACVNAGEETGKYGWKFDGELLTLNKVEDKCSGRSEEVPMKPWKREHKKK